MGFSKLEMDLINFLGLGLGVDFAFAWNNNNKRRSLGKTEFCPLVASKTIWMLMSWHKTLVLE